MLNSTLSYRAIRQAAPHFAGKAGQSQSAEEQTDASQSKPSVPTVSQPDEDTFQVSGQSAPTASKPAGILEKLFSGWGSLNLDTKWMTTGIRRTTDTGNNPASSSQTAAGSSNLIKDGKKSASRAQKNTVRWSVPPGTRLKKKNPANLSTTPQDESGSPVLTKEGKPVLPSINEHEEHKNESLLEQSLPNLKAPINQLLAPPPQLPSALEDLDTLADSRFAKTPASSLWVEDTTGGMQSRISNSIAPSRNQESEAEYDDGDDEWGNESEELLSDTSSAFLVDDDQDVQEERKTRKWAKAVKNQQLGSVIAQQIAMPDIHEDPRYLPGDSDLDSDDEALFYDSDDGPRDAEPEIEPVKPVVQKPVLSHESLLTKTVHDPRFDLVTQHQKISQASATRINEDVATQNQSQQEKRILELQQGYSPQELTANQQKLGARLEQILAHKKEFRERMKMPANGSVTLQIVNWQEQLHKMRNETLEQLENSPAESSKGKQPESAASRVAQETREALEAQLNKIEVKQQHMDTALGLYNNLKANETQIKTRLSLYQEAITRNRHQSILSQVEEASTKEKDDQDKIKIWQNLGHQYPLVDLKQVKEAVLHQKSNDTARKLEIMDHALKFQATMVDNICKRIEDLPGNTSQAHAMAQHLSKEFTPVELQEAVYALSRQQDKNLALKRDILRQAFNRAAAQ